VSFIKNLYETIPVNNNEIKISDKYTIGSLKNGIWYKMSQYLYIHNSWYGVNLDSYIFREMSKRYDVFQFGLSNEIVVVKVKVPCCLCGEFMVFKGYGSCDACNNDPYGRRFK
jgi:hypothetical protein